MLVLKTPLLIVLCTLAAAGFAAEAKKVEEKKTMTDQQRIEVHRMGDIVIHAPAGSTVSLEQKSHHFWFGTAISHSAWNEDMSEADCEQYLKVLKENFNSVVPENAAKWYHIERKPGNYNFEDADRMFRWCDENGLKVRGHCVYWAVPKYVQGWLKELDTETLEAKVRVHAFDMMHHYKGWVNEWDVNNEMLHGDFFARRLGDSIRDRMFRWCKQANPDAILYLNDYDILKGKDVDAYLRQARQFLDIGTPVGGIGVQGHFWGERFPEEKVRESFEKLSKLGLPIKVTEYDFAGTDPALQADVLERFYTIAFAEPLVNGILLWGFWDGKHWRKDGAGLWAKDWTPKPAAEAYRKLVFEKWWTRWQGQADAEGQAKLRAYYGTHTITVGDQTREVEITPENTPLVVDFVQ